MLLTVDVGNTNIKIAVFDKDERIAFDYFNTIQDSYRSLFLSVLYKSNIRESDIEDAIFSCVVPAIKDKLIEDLYSLFGKKPIEISVENFKEALLDVDNPLEVGSDLLVMARYAYDLFASELLIVSMGTCSVLIHIDENGYFKHCTIAPGFNKFAQTLWTNAANLPQVEIAKTNTFLARNTVDAMNVGIYNGYLGMIDYLISGTKKELGKDIKVIACGGLGKKIIPYLKDISYYDADFVTNGLHHIYKEYYA